MVVVYVAFSTFCGFVVVSTDVRTPLYIVVLLQSTAQYCTTYSLKRVRSNGRDARNSSTPLPPVLPYRHSAARLGFRDFFPFLLLLDSCVVLCSGLSV